MGSDSQLAADNARLQAAFDDQRERLASLGAEQRDVAALEAELAAAVQVRDANASALEAQIEEAARLHRALSALD